VHCIYLYNTRRVRNNLIAIITAERYYCLSLCCDTKQPAIRVFVGRTVGGGVGNDHRRGYCLIYMIGYPVYGVRRR